MEPRINYMSWYSAFTYTIDVHTTEIKTYMYMFKIGSCFNNYT